MARNAVLIGNSQYRSLQELPCCQNDVNAMKQLLEATEEFSTITVIEDAAADDLKSQIRAAIGNGAGAEELFFYFTGHGYQHETDFFLCAQNFERDNPNLTGLSTDELHILLREANAKLVVKVIDACNSGTLLVKSDASFAASQHPFNNLIQISSCRQNQDSLAGDPLSIFTAAFREAALRKRGGPVYYMDIVNYLRDAFIQNDEQTPFYVVQSTGREMFVDDSHCFDALRDQLVAKEPPPAESDSDQPQTTVPSLQTLLEVAEQKVAAPEVIESFVNQFFDALIQQVSDDEISPFFDLEVAEHPDFIEPTTKGFIIRVLSRQDRLDGVRYG